MRRFTAALSNSSANHLRPPLLSARWSANDPMARRSIGKSEYAKRVLMFGIAQPLALSSRPFDVAFNLHNAVWVANGVEHRLLQWRGLRCWSPPVRAQLKFQHEIRRKKSAANDRRDEDILCSSGSRQHWYWYWYWYWWSSVFDSSLSV